MSDDIWKDYDPEKVRAGIERLAGSMPVLDADAIIAELHRARRQGADLDTLAGLAADIHDTLTRKGWSLNDLLAELHDEDADWEQVAAEDFARDDDDAIYDEGDAP